MSNNVEDEILEKVKVFTEKVLDEFNGIIKSIVMVGSYVRGDLKPWSDIDILIIVDDTLPESRMNLEELEERIKDIAGNVWSRLSIFPLFALTEFVDYARIGHPVVYNLIKEGVVIYDVGFFTPWKKLLKAGKIPRTIESIERNMNEASKYLMRARTVKLLILAMDCYYAMINSAQAVLMSMGLEPPVPRKMYEEVKTYLVKPGLLPSKYAEWLNEIINIKKKIEHKELLEVSGAFVDEWIEKAEKFVEKMFRLLSVLEFRKKEKILERTHEVMYLSLIHI